MFLPAAAAVDALVVVDFVVPVPDPESTLPAEASAAAPDSPLSPAAPAAPAAAPYLMPSYRARLLLASAGATM